MDVIGYSPWWRCVLCGSEMNKWELQTYIFEHVSVSNFNVPVSGLIVPTGSEPDQADHHVKVKKGNICNNSSHIGEEHCLNLRGKEFNCSEAARI